MGRIGDALAKAGDEVRVAVGTYLLDAELFIPAGKTLSGGWIADAGVKVENPSAQTILQVTGQFPRGYRCRNYRGGYGAGRCCSCCQRGRFICEGYRGCPELYRPE